MVGYQVHITYNDDAMTSTLNLFNDIIHDNAPYPAGLVDDEVKDKLQASFDKGVECILATQIMVKGKPTVWCQQNDPVTLEPAGARAFELPAFCSAESSPVSAWSAAQMNMGRGTPASWWILLRRPSGRGSMTLSSGSLSCATVTE